jgi:hypothetical protein
MPEDSSDTNFSFPTANRPGNGTAAGIGVSDNGSFDEIRGTEEKDLSRVAKRFLVAEINRLVDENQQLKQFKDKYHDADKRLAVLKETLRPFRMNELLSSACLMAGSAGLGAAPSFLSLSSYGWYVFVSVAALLVIAAIAARFSGPTIATTRQPGASSK